MRTAKTKLAVACLLAMMVACQCQEAPKDPAGPKDPEGPEELSLEPTAVDVEVTAVSNGLNMCKDKGNGKGRTCKLVKQATIEKAAEQYENEFKSDEDLEKDQYLGSQVIPNANAQGCPAFKWASIGKTCPQCTWEDKDDCCATCRYYARVPFVIYDKYKRPCYVFNFLNGYQYTLNGSCRYPNGGCAWSFWGRPTKRCRQKYGYRRTVCLQPVWSPKWPSWKITTVWYQYPVDCQCRK